MVICCGSGGVGKTTTSAAVALRQARTGKRVAVLTIDPARRLADALSVGSIGNTAVRVPVPNLVEGHLDAMMLDAQKTFDDTIGRFAPSTEARDRILRNHYYKSVSSRLAGAHEYMAMEKLYELATSGSYDVIVLDTPPARHALDFLAAPDRMARLMDEGVMRWLTLPSESGGWRMIEKGSEVLARVLQHLVGDRTIGDIAEFFSAFQSLWAGFRDRSLKVQAMLRAPETRFVLVTTPAPAARAEALHFLEVLGESRMPFAGFLVNRCTPPVGSALPPHWSAPPAEVSAAEWAQLTTAVSAVPERVRRIVAGQEAAILGLLQHAPTGARTWRIPEFDSDIHDLVALEKVGAYLPGPEELFR